MQRGVEIHCQPENDLLRLLRPEPIKGSHFGVAVKRLIFANHATLLVTYMAINLQLLLTEENELIKLVHWFIEFTFSG